jgi:hypothetical protein
MGLGRGALVGALAIAALGGAGWFAAGQSESLPANAVRVSAYSPATGQDPLEALSL